MHQDRTRTDVFLVIPQTRCHCITQHVHCARHRKPPALRGAEAEGLRAWVSGVPGERIRTPRTPVRSNRHSRHGARTRRQPAQAPPGAGLPCKKLLRKHRGLRQARGPPRSPGVCESLPRRPRLAARGQSGPPPWHTADRAPGGTQAEPAVGESSTPQAQAGPRTRPGVTPPTRQQVAPRIRAQGLPSPSRPVTALSSGLPVRPQLS